MTNNRKVVVAGFLVENGCALVCRRPKGCPNEGMWEFPGGKQRHGEGIEECIKRELLEELGIVVRVVRAVYETVANSETGEIILHFLHCQRVQGDPRGLEGQEVRWVPMESLKDLDLLPPDREALDILIKEVGANV